MTAGALHLPAAATRTPPVERRRRRVLAWAAAVNAFLAYAGAVGLATGAIDFGDELDERLPFGNLVLAGAALLVLVAVPFTVLSWLAWRGDPRTADASVLMAAVLAGWIVLQLAFLREVSFFHPTYLAIAAAFLWAGRRRDR